MNPSLSATSSATYTIQVAQGAGGTPQTITGTLNNTTNTGFQSTDVFECQPGDIVTVKVGQTTLSGKIQQFLNPSSPNIALDGKGLFLTSGQVGDNEIMLAIKGTAAAGGTDDPIPEKSRTCYIQNTSSADAIQIVQTQSEAMQDGATSMSFAVSPKDSKSTSCFADTVYAIRIGDKSVEVGRNRPDIITQPFPGKNVQVGYNVASDFVVVVSDVSGPSSDPSGSSTVPPETAKTISKHLPVWAIVLIVIGCLVVLAFIIWGIVYATKRKSTQAKITSTYTAA